jgi:molybdenum cofactor cytidylyltransferase
VSITALILAAGRSRRMGAHKAFLELDHEPLLSRILGAAFAGGVAHAVVVVGATADPRLVTIAAVERLVAQRHPALAAQVRIVVGEPDRTPIDSIRAGLKALEPGTALLLWPVDSPFADAQLVRSLIDRLADAPDRIARPVDAGHGGHPVLFGAEVVRELTAPAANLGAHTVVNQDPRRLLDVPFHDSRLLAQLNTPAQASALGVRIPSA